MHALNRIPLPALRAVEAVARLGTLSRAADELGVTPGAVSQQVIRAERRLGLVLFERRASGMAPTPLGQEIAGLLSDGFGRVAAAVALAEGRRRNTLALSVAPIFAARWLIWRLPLFHSAHPDIRIRLDAELGLVDPGTGTVDMCVRVGKGGGAGVEAERLFGQVIFPVAAPDLARRLRSPADLSAVPIIREPRPGFDWEDWLVPEGYGGLPLGEGPVFSDASLCLDAAMAGGGVFLAFETLAADALAVGRLVAPFAGRHETRNSYWLITPGARRPTAPARAFIRWLKDQIAKEGLGKPRPAPMP
jgi:DNA-binding transcriptional LysR family regulator